MPFIFLKYLQPVHYFRLASKMGQTVFPIVEELPADITELLVKDTDFESDIAQDYDLSWQAIQKGYIGSATTYKAFETLSVRDNYYFIRKNFHPAWVFYILLLRLITLCNPLKEVHAWYSTRSTKREALWLKPIQYSGWHSFQSALLKASPKVSVVIPTLNRYDYLKDILCDLEQQDYTNFEVIIVDQSDSFEAAFYDKFKLDIHLIRQEEKALWLARNTAIKKAKGSLIALSEDDVRVDPNWISEHIKCLDFFKADVSAGVFHPINQSIPPERSFFSLASQFATGNAMLYRGVFKKVGLFDRQFEKQRMGDGEFGMRLHLAGIKSVSNPKASCIDVKANVGGLRELGSWDAFRPSKFFSPRPIPSVLYFYRRYFGNQAARFALLRTVPLSIFPYQFKRNRLLLLIGAVISVLLLPIVCVQVLMSWRLATKKIVEGPKTEQWHATN